MEKLHQSLSQFKDKIEEYKKESFRLTDTFEFKIIETSKLIATSCEINSCQFNTSFEIRGHNITFNNCVFTQSLDLSLVDNAITFNNCYFLKGVLSRVNEIANNVINPLKFKSCHIPKSQTLDLGKCTHLIIEDTSVDKLLLGHELLRVDITGSGKYEEIQCFIKNSNANIAINKVSLIKKITFSSSIEGDINLRDSEINDINFNEAKCRHLRILNIANSKCLTIEKTRLQFLNIEGESCPKKIVFDGSTVPTNKGKVNINVRNCELDHLEIKNINYESSLNIHRIKNIEALILSEIKCPNVIISEIGLSKLSIDRDVDLTDWTFNFIHWSKDFEIFIRDNQNVSPIDQFLFQIETSRKLKKYFKEKDNLIEYQVFKRTELDSLLSYLSARRKNKDLSRGQKWDYYILLTNKVFSDFGNSITKPVKYLLFFHSLLFTWLILESNYELGLNLCFEEVNCEFRWNKFYHMVSLFINLINPIHKLVDVNGSSILSIPDFLIRISSGYFIFYFLRATRKFSRV